MPASRRTYSAMASESGPASTRDSSKCCPHHQQCSNRLQPCINADQGSSVCVNIQSDSLSNKLPKRHQIEQQGRITCKLPQCRISAQSGLPQVPKLRQQLARGLLSHVLGWARILLHPSIGVEALVGRRPRRDGLAVGEQSRRAQLVGEVIWWQTGDGGRGVMAREAIAADGRGSRA